MSTIQQRSCPNGFIYTVVRGDTLYLLARRYNTTVRAIEAANPDIRNGRIHTGQRICIPVQAPASCPGGTVYTIVAGDTLSALARRYNTTVSAIEAANPGIDPNRLYIGQRICIPAPAPPPTPSCPGGTLYTVVSGDTLSAIAARYGVTLRAIINANPGINPDVISVGQQICIPVKPSPSCPNGTLYTIVAGDTLSALARRYGTTVSAIEAANPGIDPERLYIGQQICIPAPAPAPTAPACPDGTLYTIKGGDSLSLIAARFNTTVSAIEAANPGIDPNRLRIGQQICIPAAPSPTAPSCPNGTIYTVVAGDTLSAIAFRFNTTLSAIYVANPGIDPSKLYVGQRICIPAAVSCPDGTIYTVVAGDTLGAIAARFNTTVSAITGANPGLSATNLYVGQRICIPVAPSPTGPTLPACQDGTLYTVVAGDTLTSIASKFGTTNTAIRNANPGLDPYHMHAGDVLCIPVPPSATLPSCPNGRLYTVVAGDTLTSIAARFNVTAAKIRNANPGLDPYHMHAGDVLCVPFDPPSDIAVSSDRPGPCPLAPCVRCVFSDYCSNYFKMY